MGNFKTIVVLTLGVAMSAVKKDIQKVDRVTFIQQGGSCRELLHESARRQVGKPIWFHAFKNTKVTNTRQVGFFHRIFPGSYLSHHAPVLSVASGN
ncbi:MAG TPA: hypothetical protein VLZ84_02125 [Asticcacaulis sp.]|nr:hypothetical protein [Asticcacaulis sp.]